MKHKRFLLTPAMNETLLDSKNKNVTHERHLFTKSYSKLLTTITPNNYLPFPFTNAFPKMKPNTP